MVLRGGMRAGRSSFPCFQVSGIPREEVSQRQNARGTGALLIPVLCRDGQGATAPHGGMQQLREGRGLLIFHPRWVTGRGRKGSERFQEAAMGRPGPGACASRDTSPGSGPSRRWPSHPSPPSSLRKSSLVGADKYSCKQANRTCPVMMQEQAGGGAVNVLRWLCGAGGTAQTVPGCCGWPWWPILCPQHQRGRALLGRGKKSQNGPPEGGEGGVWVQQRGEFGHWGCRRGESIPNGRTADNRGTVGRGLSRSRGKVVQLSQSSSL